MNTDVTTTNTRGWAWAQLRPQAGTSAPFTPRYLRENVISAVCDAFDINRARLTASVRTRDHVVPRWVAMRLLRTETDATLPEIAHLLGLADHSTVMYGLQRVQTMLDADQHGALAHVIDTIRERALALPPPALQPSNSPQRMGVAV